MSRIDRLRASLEEPLLVTNGVNVRYLVGFSSSNAALFVEPERVRLFSDFRYAEAARAVEGVEFVETKRSLVAALAELLEGTVGFEADAVSYASWEVLRAGGLALVPRRGLVEALRAVKDEPSWTRSAAPARSRARPTRASPRSASSAAPSASSPGGWTSSSTSSAPTRRPSRRSSPRARTPRSRTRARPTARSRPARRSWSTRARWSTATTPTARAPSPPARCRTSSRPPTRRRSRASSPGLEATRAGVTGVDADAAARDKIEAAGFGENFGHGLGHGVGLEVHEAPRLSRESSDTLAGRQRRHGRAGRLPRRPGRDPDRGPRDRDRRRARGADEPRQGL